MNIYGNERADENAKLGSKLTTVHHEAITSLSFLKRKVQECCLDDWQKEWQIQRIRVNTNNNSIALQNGRHLKKRCKKEVGHHTVVGRGGGHRTYTRDD